MTNYIVITDEKTNPRAFGLYRSFKRASDDAQANGGYVLLLERDILARSFEGDGELRDGGRP